ncbi:MAG: hypothetical protein ACRDZY_04390, partial [Acidimicrobiales bacterium]
SRRFGIFRLQRGMELHHVRAVAGAIDELARRGGRVADMKVAVRSFFADAAETVPILCSDVLVTGVRASRDEVRR